MLIKNKEELIQNTHNMLNQKGRKIILETFDRAIESVLPANLIKKNVSLENNELIISDLKINLNEVFNIFVIGAGKASGKMALALQKILNERINSGIINVPDGTENEYRQLKHIEIVGAGHPIPTKKGMIGSKKMLEIINNAENNDLIICLISGGGSALLPLPASAIELSDLQDLNDVLLKSGMTIKEMNIIRKHCSEIKGGQLVKNNKAQFISLIISDVLDDPIDMIASGPTVPDRSTFDDVKKIINHYNLKQKLPKNIQLHFEKGYTGEISDTPRKGNPIFDRVKNIIIGNLKLALMEAIDHAKNYGIKVEKIGFNITGEASEVGFNIIEDLIAYKKPIILIGGGETTVTIKGDGKGGRSQEMILAACKKIQKDGIVIGSIGTDGIDGNSDAAGAIADFTIVKKSQKKGINIQEYLSNNNSYNFFNKIDDGLIMTGYTGTNVNDLYIFLSLIEN